LDYLEEEDFNESWDDSFGEFVIGDYSYPASEILFNVDKQVYVNEYKFKNSLVSESTLLLRCLISSNDLPCEVKPISFLSSPIFCPMVAKADGSITEWGTIPTN
jgi:hypothetical protein